MYANWHYTTGLLRLTAADYLPSTAASMGHKHMQRWHVALPKCCMCVVSQTEAQHRVVTGQCVKTGHGLAIRMLTNMPCHSCAGSATKFQETWQAGVYVSLCQHAMPPQSASSMKTGATSGPWPVVARQSCGLAAGSDEAGAHQILWGAGPPQGGAPSCNRGRPHRVLCAHAGTPGLCPAAGAVASPPGAECCPVWPHPGCWPQAGQELISLVTLPTSRCTPCWPCWNTM